VTVTDRQTTDRRVGTATAFSEREREFTFSKNCKKKRALYFKALFSVSD